MSYRTELGDGLLLLVTGWALVVLQVLDVGRADRRLFAWGLASTTLWATVLGLALCHFTDAHAIVSGVA